ncbi:hypothetical protein BC936DRAFT_138271 [Jimgerdemannia flammicorona]|uniref:FAD-binding PCMH-type domain-containing protein n=1 Tax=Jimgerdemannia flammicorona TaxID=994334 RepID=A0A433DIN3_9FUNG|nr:hypothetical protein BC936DRAFT_138271 [Jimgerdemannia flammicorona]
MARFKLSLLASLFSLALIGVVAATPQHYVYYNATLSYTYCSPSSIRTPTTIHAVQKIVQEAHKFHLKVKAFGAHHSTTDIICPPPGSIAIDSTHLNWININKKVKTVKVGAGALEQNVIDALEAQGFSFVQTTYYGGITMGGATGTGAHGSSFKHASTFSEMLVGMTIVTGTGEVLTIKGRDLDDFRVHLGFLGVVVELEFSVVPLYKVLVTAYPIDDAILYTPAFLQMAEVTDSLIVNWIPRMKKLAIVNRTYVPVGTPGNGTATGGGASVSSVEQRVQETQIFDYFEVTRNQTAMCAVEEGYFYSVFSDVTSQGFPPAFLNDTGNFANPVVGFPRNILVSTCKAPNCSFLAPSPVSLIVDISRNRQFSNTHVFQANPLYYLTLHLTLSIQLLTKELAFAIPARNLQLFLAIFDEIYKKYPSCIPLSGVLFRFAPPSRGLVAIEQDEPTVHFELLIHLVESNHDIASMQLEFFQALSKALYANKKLEARPHWGKNSHEIEFSSNSSLTYAPPGIPIRQPSRRLRAHAPQTCARRYRSTQPPPRQAVFTDCAPARPVRVHRQALRPQGHLPQ